MHGKYLGSEVVSHEEAGFKDYEPFDWAMYFIANYGGFVGAYHKDWVMDQVARIYNGTPVIVEKRSWEDGYYEYQVNLGEPTQKYHNWVADLKEEDGDPEAYDYEVGIAP